MNIIKFIFILLTAFYPEYIFAAEIINYQSYSGVCISKDGESSLRFALRKYTKNNSEYLLTVDPFNLNTFIEPNSSSTSIFKSMTFQEIRTKYSKTNYCKAIVNSETNVSALQNAGITHLPRINNGVIITADLCPSILPMDNNFFTTIIDKFAIIKKPVPVALSVTGLWMENHTEDIKWLKALEQKSLLSITWINHSYNHRFIKDLPLKNNFFLLPDTNIESEILNTEKKMLEAGLMPSVFFRFPGLISNPDIFYKITGYGLIPVGSDAWLGKNQWPKHGSIILVHANGNEPIGISRFKELLRRERKNILNKRWILFDLKENVAGEVKE